jgi:hypothetical protein
MSLISEALRKAQLEAVQQDRDQRRFYMSHAGRPGASRPASTPAIVAIAILAGLCFASGAALFYMSVKAPQAAASSSVASSVSLPAAPAVRSAPVTPPVAPPAAAKIEAPAKEPASKASVQPKTRTAGRAPVAEPQNPTSNPERRKPTPLASTASGITVVARQATPPPRRLARDGFRDGETYGSPVLGPFGTEVVLTGITELRGQFIAIVNGSTVRAGAAIGPFVIEEIDAHRVRLRYVDITFYVVQ